MKRCQVNAACKRKAASYWFWTTGDGPVIVTLTDQKPTRTAVRCCAECAKEIWKRQSEAT